jgi:hypothetical protein
VLINPDRNLHLGAHPDEEAGEHCPVRRMRFKKLEEAKGNHCIEFSKSCKIIP